MSIGVKNEKRIPKEDTPLVAPTTSERGGLNWRLPISSKIFLRWGIGKCVKIELWNLLIKP